MHVRRWPVAIACGAAIGLAVLPGAAPAQVVEHPSDLPYYARAVEGSGKWSPIVFYRPVRCVPETFNLEAFFDLPGAFGCDPMTVDSFALWKNGPGIDPAPVLAIQKGLGAVPIWFVRTDDLLAARGDGVVTLPELRSLDPQIGSATRFTETLLPEETVKRDLLIVNASGKLAGGRSFSLHVTRFDGGRVRKVLVRFGR